MSKRSHKNIFKRVNFDWFRKLGRNTKLVLSLALVLVVVGVLSLVFSRSSEPKSVVEDTEQVVEIETAELMPIFVSHIEGTLEYRTVEQDWKIADEKLEIEPNMSLRTVGAISRGVLELEDGSEVRMDANTLIEVTSMTTSRVIITQEDGYVFSRIVASDARDYIIQTENAQFQAVGTGFRTITTGDEEAVEVYQSIVEEVVTNKSAQSGEKLIIEENNEEVSSKIENIQIKTLKDNDFINWNIKRDQNNELFRNELGYLNDFEGPEIKIKDPKPSTTITIDSNEDPKITIKGETEAGAKLTVRSKSISGSKAKDVTVENNGTFTTPELKSNIGRSVFEFIATDRRGNETKLNVSFTFSRKVSTQEQGIALTLAETADQITLEWGLVGITTPSGVQVVYKKSSGPVYNGPETIAALIKDTSKTTFKKSDLDKDTTYYFKICRYLENDTCDTYSNEVSVTIPADTPTP